MDGWMEAQYKHIPGGGSNLSCLLSAQAEAWAEHPRNLTKALAELSSVASKQTTR